MRAPRPRLRLLLKLVVSAALLVGVFSFVPFGAVLRGLGRVDGRYLAAGLALSPVALYLGAVRTGMFARRLGLTLTVGQVFRIGYVAQFYDLFLPGIIAGGAIRWHRFARHDGRPLEALATIAAGRLSNLFFGVACGLLAWSLDPVARNVAGFGVGLVVALLALGGAFWLVQHPALTERAARLVAANRRLPERLRRGAAGALESARGFGRSSGLAAPLVIVGVLEQGIAVASDLLLARAVGLQVGVAAIAWVRAYQLLIALLPITVGSLGTREGGMVVMLAAYGVSPELAVAYSLLLFGRRLLSSLVGAGIEVAGFLRSGFGAPRTAGSEAVGRPSPQVQEGR